MKQLDKDFLAPRRCLREPVPEIFEAAGYLSLAVEAHLSGNRSGAAHMIGRANQPAIRDWVAPLLGSVATYPDRADYVRYRPVPAAPPVLSKSVRVAVRMPNAEQQAELIRQQGRHCGFCHIPLISADVRKALVRAYPGVATWGAKNADCHSALLCMWLQFDHLLPHSRGGGNDLSNIQITCSGCNYGRMALTLEEVGLLNPRLHPRRGSDWDGLERFLSAAA
ncbi:HNH endonuclease [Brevundimonas aurifodinae]|uniref:HNH endonuclease n=1 Tax=Brevundimonas aurifodinae TaxID=1508312 RepID=UPI0026D0F26E